VNFAPSRIKAHAQEIGKMAVLKLTMEINGITDEVLQVTHHQANCHFYQFHSSVLIWSVHGKFAISASLSKPKQGCTNPRRLVDNIL